VENFNEMHPVFIYIRCKKVEIKKIVRSNERERGHMVS
jgi:hypothetical protein